MISGIFTEYQRTPAYEEDIFTSLQQQYSNVFHQTTSSDESHYQHSHHTNPYTLRQFEVSIVLPDDPYGQLIPIYKREFVFTCLFQEQRATRNSCPGSDEENWDEENSTDIICPFYVSKLYDILHGFRAHRFVFLEKGEVFLAEVSAEAYIRPDFNVELHYLELRKRHQPGKGVR